MKSVSVIKNREIAESVINDNRFRGGNAFLPNSYITFKTYKDRNEKRIYTLDKESNLSATTVLLDEEIYPQEWTIHNDTTRILNYLCNKATTKFRGREYEVYFTPDIPVNEGPWKLYGLPGLILTAKTKDGVFSFNAIGIQGIDDKIINLPDGKNSEVCKDLKEYHQFVQAKAKNETYMYEKNGDITIAERFSSAKVVFMETEE